MTGEHQGPTEERTSHRMFAASFQASAIGKAIIDLSGRCVQVNTSFAGMLGYTTQELVGVPFADFTHPDDLEADLHLFDAVMRGERDSYQLEKRYLHRDGSIIDVLLSAAVVREDDGHPIQFISEVFDITERMQVRSALQEANLKLQELVVTDHLTGLRNRRGFEEALSRAPDPSGTCVLLIDLDNFKRVNDQLGHDAGDAVLAEVGARLALHARRGDVIARLGGDEFALILFDTDRAAAQTVAHRIVTALSRSYGATGPLSAVGASVGLCCSGPDTVDLRQLVAQADEALYAAKRAGRGRLRVIV